MLKPAVDRSGLEVRRVLLGNPEVHAAVARFDVEPFALPAGTFEIDVDAAVARASLHVARHVRELHAAVDGTELDLAVDVADRDAAVGRLQRQHRHRRHRQSIADRPALRAARGPTALRPTRCSAWRSTLTASRDLLGPRLRLGLSPTTLASTRMSLRGVAFDVDAAVRLGVDRQGAGGGDGELRGPRRLFTVAIARILGAAPVVAVWAARCASAGSGGRDATASENTVGRARFVIMVDCSSSTSLGNLGRDIRGPRLPARPPWQKLPLNRAESATTAVLVGSDPIQSADFPGGMARLAGRMGSDPGELSRGGRRITAMLWQDIRYGVRTLVTNPGLHGDGDPLPLARHRPERRHLQRRRRRPAAAVPLSRRRPHRRPQLDEPARRRHRIRRLVAGLPRLSASRTRTLASIAAFTGRTLTISDGTSEPERYLGAAGLVVALRAARHAARPRPRLPARRRPRRRRTRRDAERRGLAAALSRPIRAIVGRGISINGFPHTVIGVMPPGFMFPETQRLWVPLAPLLRDDAARRSRARTCSRG